VARYIVDSRASRILVKARSSIHDTDTRWDHVEGQVEADPDTLETAGATGSFTVDMTRFDAGDWLKNRKLKKDLDVESYPSASFAITGLRDVARVADGSFEAICDGVLSWRGREVTISVRGTGRVDDGGIEAVGTFDLDITDLGVKPPKILMFKVEEQVTVEVTLEAKAA
jgi:polyisoprenoid-binding protein YceI